MVPGLLDKDVGTNSSASEPIRTRLNSGRWTAVFSFPAPIYCFASTFDLTSPDHFFISVTLRFPNHKPVHTYALVDCGASSSCISEVLCVRHSLPRRMKDVPIPIQRIHLLLCFAITLPALLHISPPLHHLLWPTTSQKARIRLHFPNTLNTSWKNITVVILVRLVHILSHFTNNFQPLHMFHSRCLLLTYHLILPRSVPSLSSLPSLPSALLPAAAAVPMLLPRSLSPSRSLSDERSLVNSNTPVCNPSNVPLPKFSTSTSTIHPIRPSSPPRFKQNLCSNYVPPSSTTLRTGCTSRPPARFAPS